jgi:hypothetical protein
MANKILEVTIGIASERLNGDNKAAHGRSVSHLVLPKQTAGILRPQAYHGRMVVSTNFLIHFAFVKPNSGRAHRIRNSISVQTV